MQTAVPAGAAVFRGKWKRTDSRFAAFGGRGELRSPLSPHRNAPSGHSGVPHGLFYDQAILWLDLQNAHAPGSLRSPSDAAPKCFFKTFRCSARLIFRCRTDPPSVRRCSARLIRQAETLELQPLRGLRLRTVMTLRDIPVFRSAYFPKRPFGLFSKTLDLQVRFAHPSVGGEELLL